MNHYLHISVVIFVVSVCIVKAGIHSVVSFITVLFFIIITSYNPTWPLYAFLCWVSYDKYIKFSCSDQAMIISSREMQFLHLTHFSSLLFTFNLRHILYKVTLLLWPSSPK